MRRRLPIAIVIAAIAVQAPRLALVAHEIDRTPVAPTVRHWLVTIGGSLTAAVALLAIAHLAHHIATNERNRALLAGGWLALVAMVTVLVTIDLARAATSTDLATVLQAAWMLEHWPVLVYCAIATSTIELAASLVLFAAASGATVEERLDVTERQLVDAELRAGEGLVPKVRKPSKTRPSSKRRGIAPEVRARVAVLRAKGVAAKRIADDLGLSVWQVYRVDPEVSQ